MAEKTALTLSDLTLRDMVNQDLNEVLVIERNAHISPWSRLSFEESLTRSENLLTSNEELFNPHEESLTSRTERPLTSRTKELPASYRCRLVEGENTIFGYHIVSIVADELHLLNVVVASKAQGLGLGHVLMQDIEQLARTHELKKIFLEVRASNSAAQGLYLKWQFEQIAVRNDYYSTASPVPKSDGNKSSQSKSPSRREDALVFVRVL